MRALPSHLKRAFLDGDWDVFAGQYFDKFDLTRHVARAEAIDWKPWWPRWISIDWGYEHYAATYWHAAVPGSANLPIGASNLDRKTNAPSQAPADSSRVSSRAEGRSSSPAPASGAVGPQFEGSAFSPASNLSPNAAANITGADAPTDRHSERSVPSSPLREAPGRAVEESLFDLAATSAPNPAAPHPAKITGEATDVECGSSLPPSAARACPGVLQPPVHSAIAASPGASLEGDAFSSDAASSAPNPAANIADENRRREEAAPKFPRRPRSWLGFAGTIPGTPPESPGSSTSRGDENSRCVVSYREYVTHRTAPRELAREIVRRSVHSDRHPERSVPSSSLREAPGHAVEGPLFDAAKSYASASTPEKIDAIYLSPDAFARRTDEASIAEQMGDIFVAAGLPRPIPADDDRIGGWMLMYQMLDAGEWLLTENCAELIRTLPNLIRDPARIEDIEKMDGDDAADAARYGLKSRYGAHRVVGEHRMPLADRIAARVVSDDPTIRAMQARKAQVEESRRTKPVKFPHRRRHR